jgi:hypothetical protein
MPKSVHFDSKIIEPNNSINLKKISNFSAKKARNSNYNTLEAYNVAKRLEGEINNKNILEKRLANEMYVESLLLKNRLLQFIPRLYRLDDKRLLYLKEKLLAQEKFTKSSTVPLRLYKRKF